jgi:hypothetical protein
MLLINGIYISGGVYDIYIYIFSYFFKNIYKLNLILVLYLYIYISVWIRNNFYRNKLFNMMSLYLIIHH